MQSNASLVLNDKTIHHVQVITWDVERDCFALGVAVKEKSFSRSGILSMPSALFDPLGFVAPVTLLA